MNPNHWSFNINDYEVPTRLSSAAMYFADIYSGEWDVNFQRICNIVLEVASPSFIASGYVEQHNVSDGIICLVAHTLLVWLHISV